MLAWPDGTPIRLIRREPSDADWTLLRALSAEMADAVQVALERPGLLTPATDQENADALERLSGSFGTMSIGQMRAEARRVSPLVLDGEPPTVEALAGRPLQTVAHPVCRLARSSRPGDRAVPGLSVRARDQASCWRDWATFRLPSTAA